MLPGGKATGALLLHRVPATTCVVPPNLPPPHVMSCLSSSLCQSFFFFSQASPSPCCAPELQPMSCNNTHVLHPRSGWLAGRWRSPPRHQVLPNLPAHVMHVFSLSPLVVVTMSCNNAHVPRGWRIHRRSLSTKPMSRLGHSRFPASCMQVWTDKQTDRHPSHLASPLCAFLGMSWVFSAAPCRCGSSQGVRSSDTR